MSDNDESVTRTRAQRLAYGDDTEQQTHVSTASGLPTQEVASGTSNLGYHDSGGFVNDGVIKASAGVLYGIDGYTKIAGFFQTFMSATVPVDTTVPDHSQPMTINTSFSYDPPLRVSYTGGISYAISSTADTLTKIVTNETLVYGYFK